MAGAPGVQMAEVPPSLASWIADEDEKEEKEAKEEGNEREEDPHRATNDYFGSERDREGLVGGGDGYSAGTSAATSAATTPASAFPPRMGGGPHRSRLSVSSGIAPSTPSLVGGTAGKKRRKVIAGGTKEEGAMNPPPNPSRPGMSTPAASGKVAKPRMDPGGADDEE